MYKVFLSREAEKSLAKLPPLAVQKISQALDKLESNPFDFDLKIKKLVRPLVGYRCKVWPYRILYIVDTRQHQVWVYKIFHRGERLLKN